MGKGWLLLSLINLEGGLAVAALTRKTQEGETSMRRRCVQGIDGLLGHQFNIQAYMSLASGVGPIEALRVFADEGIALPDTFLAGLDTLAIKKFLEVITPDRQMYWQLMERQVKTSNTPPGKVSSLFEKAQEAFVESVFNEKPDWNAFTRMVHYGVLGYRHDLKKHIGVHFLWKNVPREHRASLLELLLEIAPFKVNIELFTQIGEELKTMGRWKHTINIIGANLKNMEEAGVLHKAVGDPRVTDRYLLQMAWKGIMPENPFGGFPFAGLIPPQYERGSLSDYFGSILGAGLVGSDVGGKSALIREAVLNSVDAPEGATVGDEDKVAEKPTPEQPAAKPCRRTNKKATPRKRAKVGMKKGTRKMDEAKKTKKAVPKKRLTKKVTGRKRTDAKKNAAGKTPRTRKTVSAQRHQAAASA